MGRKRGKGKKAERKEWEGAKKTADKYRVLINNYIIPTFSLSSLKGVPYLPS